MKSPKTQQEAIAQHLLKGKSIGPLAAIKLYGCTRLATKIGSLRKRGWKIKTDSISVKHKYGYMVQYANYKLIKKGK